MTPPSSPCPICGMVECDLETGSLPCIEGLAEVNYSWLKKLEKARPKMKRLPIWGILERGAWSSKPADVIVTNHRLHELRPLWAQNIKEAYRTYQLLDDWELECVSDNWKRGGKR